MFVGTFGLILGVEYNPCIHVHIKDYPMYSSSSPT